MRNRKTDQHRFQRLGGIGRQHWREPDLAQATRNDWHGRERELAGCRNAQLFITGGGINAGATADGNGNFSTIGLPVGNYSITATASGQPNTTLNLSISNSLQGLIIHMGGISTAAAPSGLH